MGLRVMNLNLFFANAHRERIFYIEQICNALGVEYVIIIIEEDKDISIALSESNAIIFLDYSHSKAKSERIIGTAISMDYKARLICFAKSDIELFRFVPARPFALIKDSNYEKLLPDLLKKLINEMHKECEEFLYFDIKKGKLRILPDELVSLEGNVLNLVNNKSFQLAKTKIRLADERFMRISRDCVINLKNVLSIDENTICMSSGKRYELNDFMKKKLSKWRKKFKY